MEMPNGGVWNVQALYLRAGGGCSSLLVRRNGEYHQWSITGDAAVITDGSGNVLSSNEGKGALPQKIARFSGDPCIGLEYDSFGVAMYTSGNAQTPYRPAGLVLDEGKGVGLEEGLDFSGPPVACPLYVNRALALSDKPCGGGPPRKHPPQPKPPDCSKFNYIWKTPNNNTILIAYGLCSLAQHKSALIPVMRVAKS
ncbi:MAG TPA: hypothetical protein VKV18_07410 [Chthonomonas sp.]|uniref:hypothetical protein n=1 Tax=Chthonomonas sp. TaxID=2282153 RepID=UPI002B4B7561|nr:hypothetical protein [Chthonomonas sp.]HLI48493.1 hypothetical protein [Chthonomonas sp.]